MPRRRRLRRRRRRLRRERERQRELQSRAAFDQGLPQPGHSFYHSSDAGYAAVEFLVRVGGTACMRCAIGFEDQHEVILNWEGSLTYEIKDGKLGRRLSSKAEEYRAFTGTSAPAVALSHDFQTATVSFGGGSLDCPLVQWASMVQDAASHSGLVVLQAPQNGYPEGHEVLGLPQQGPVSASVVVTPGVPATATVTMMGVHAELENVFTSQFRDEQGQPTRNFGYGWSHGVGYWWESETPDLNSPLRNVSIETHRTHGTWYSDSAIELAHDEQRQRGRNRAGFAVGNPFLSSVEGESENPAPVF